MTNERPHELPPAPSNPWAGVSIPFDPSQTGPYPVRRQTAPTAEFKETPIQPVELGVAIDKSALANLELPDRLAHLKATFLKLPEQLDFEPGVTLIFGDNGSGKSTLARAVFYLLKSAEAYRSTLEFWGKDEIKAQDSADWVFELPKNRGTDFEQYLAAGFAPQIAKCMRLSRYQNNTYPRFLDTQEEVGRLAQIQREMARQMGMRETFGGRFEFGGSAHETTELVNENTGSLSARQTVDETIREFLRQAFWPRHRVTGEQGWQTPDSLLFHEIGRSAIRERGKITAPGIGFLDEPETGMDPERHMRLPNDMPNWAPSGSMLIVPSNSTELFRSRIPRIDLSRPELGIYQPQQ